MDLTLNTLLIFTIMLLCAAYIYSDRKIDIIFLVPLISYTLIFIASVNGIPLSYLENQKDISYYNKVIWLDIVAYVTLFYATRITSIDKILKSSYPILHYNWIYIIGLICIIINLCVVLPYLGQPYIIITSKHTPLSEIGWILVAMYIVINSTKSNMKYFVYLTLFLIMISIPFGARMQPSFGIMAILVYMSQYNGKLKILIIFTLLTVASIIVGTARDLITDTVNLAPSLQGFNQGAIFRTSAVILQYIEQLSFSERVITTLSTFFLYPITGTLIATEQVYLNLELKKVTHIQGNGGNFGTLMYYYFSYLFPVIIVITAIILNNLKAFQFVIVLLIVTSFRWQQYNFIPILKIVPIICLMVALIYILPKKWKAK